MIFIGTSRIIEDILEEHIETLPFLWEARFAKLRSPEASSGSLADIEERIAAHTDALVLAGSDAVSILVKELEKNEAFSSLAAGYCLLCMGDPEAANVVEEALKAATGSCLDELSWALSYGPIDSIAANLREITRSHPLPVAAATARALAFHGDFDLAKKRMWEFLNCDQSGVRKIAWEMAAFLGGIPDTASMQSSSSSQSYQQGLQDQDSEVRIRALETAAWNRQPWLLDYCRTAARNPSPDRLAIIRMLACLGKIDDLDLILAAGKIATLGLCRFKVLASFGHPNVIPLLLEGIRDPDPAVAVAAASAYTKLTGVDIHSGKRTTLPSPDGVVPDEFEQEFIEEIELPDPQAADSFWKRKTQEFSKGTRWCRGFDISKGANIQVLAGVDLEACYEACLRGKFEGTWNGSARDLATFPRKLE
jgi:uncharacterized protein (TIGR02270 family)